MQTSLKFLECEHAYLYGCARAYIGGLHIALYAYKCVHVRTVCVHETLNSSQILPILGGVCVQMLYIPVQRTLVHIPEGQPYIFIIQCSI